MLRLMLCLAVMAALTGAGCSRGTGPAADRPPSNAGGNDTKAPAVGEPKITAQSIGVAPYPGATPVPGASVVETDTPDGPAQVVSTRTRDSVEKVLKHYRRAVRNPSVVEKRDGGMVVGRTGSGRSATITVVRSEPFTVITVAVRPQLGKEQP